MVQFVLLLPANCTVILVTIWVGQWVSGHGSRVSGSRVTGHGSVGHWSRVMGQRVTGHGSVGHGSSSITHCYFGILHLMHCYHDLLFDSLVYL